MMTETKVKEIDLDAIARVLNAYDLLGGEGVQIDQGLWLEAMEEFNKLKAIIDSVPIDRNAAVEKMQ